MRECARAGARLSPDHPLMCGPRDRGCEAATVSLPTPRCAWASTGWQRQSSSLETRPPRSPSTAGASSWSRGLESSVYSLLIGFKKFVVNLLSRNNKHFKIFRWSVETYKRDCELQMDFTIGNSKKTAKKSGINNQEVNENESNWRANHFSKT